MLSFLAQLADDFAHVRQQQLGDRLRLPHVVLRSPRDEMAGDFEVQAQRSQVVADEVVQVARNSHAFGDPARFGQ